MADSSLDPTEDLVALFSLGASEQPPFEKPIRQPELHKRCGKCGQLKERSAFTRDRKNRDGLYPWCIVCKNHVRAVRYHRDHRLKRLQSARHRERTYGLDRAQYEAMLAAQDGQCAICREALEPGRQTHVDHCHTSGKVRALLCAQCNLAVGTAERNDEARFAAIRAYISRHNG